MGNRLSKIYTKTGDDGSTALGDFSRVRKTDVRLAAYADTDEGNAAIGVAVTVGGLTVDRSARVAVLDGRPLDLTRMEFDLLAYLAGRPGRVVTKRQLMAEVWQQPYGGADKTVDVHLSWLRRKLGETAAEPRYLQTVRGVGVKLVDPDTAT